MSDGGQVPSEDDILRRALFIPCYTKEDLHRWIQIYLGLNMPDTIVDEESNSSPMDMIWEIYRKAMENDDENFSRVMAYASRDSMKTLGAAVLEVLAVLHLDRDVAHMAAIKEQAKKAQSYVKKFFRYPYLKDYVTSANTEKTEIVWYHNEDTGDCLTKDQYLALIGSEQIKYKEHARYIKIVICTMQGANSEHVPFFVVDEVDVVPKQNQQAYQESKSIPAMFEGKEPITLLTSTRKFAFGNVQRELDNADKSHLVVRHWNIIDVTEKCPPERHLPDEPRIPIYFSREDLSSISPEEWAQLAEDKQEQYTLSEGYSGCLKKKASGQLNCELFAMCRGQLATKQKFHPKSPNKQGKLEFSERPMPLVKSFKFTTSKFRELNLDMAKAQLMCWQASQEGLIYSYLDKQKHLLTPGQIAQKVTGESYPENFTFEQLLHLFKGRDGKWVAGIDHGFTHMFSVVLFFVDGNRAFVVGRWQQPELDPAEKIELLDRTIKEFDPIIYPDTEQPDMNKFMKKHGYRVKEWTKGPGSVLSGIETVRYKIKPGILSDPQLFFAAGGPGVEEHFDVLKLYHWEVGPDGNPTNEPDEVVSQTEDGDKILDDECDAIRYGLMNVFGKHGKISVSREEVKLPQPSAVRRQQTTQAPEQQAWAQQILEHALGYSQGDLPDPEAELGTQVQVTGKKGNTYWDL